MHRPLRPLRLFCTAVLLLGCAFLGAPASAQCYSSGYSYSYSYPTTYYQPYYVPTAVAYPVPYYGSAYGKDYSVANELKQFKAELELEKLKADIAALKANGPPPAPPPVPQQAPPQQSPAPVTYQQPVEDDYPAPVPAPAPRAPQRTYASAPQQAPQQECKTCQTQPTVPAQAPRAPAYRQPQRAPQRAPAYVPEEDDGGYMPPAAPRQMPKVASSRGQWLGQQACAVCHTPNQADQYGGGRAYFRDSMGLNWSIRPAQAPRLAKAIRSGTMPPPDSGVTLSKPDRELLAKFVEGIPARQGQLARREE